MIKFYISIDYTADPESIWRTKQAEGGTKTKFLCFCMQATGVWRLFDKEAIKEFLYRLAVIFKTFDILPKFFTDDTLIAFEHEGKNVELDLRDVIEHFGMEISDSTSNFIERTVWLENIGVLWEHACIGALWAGVPLIDKKLVGVNKYKIGSNKPKFNDEIGKHAELLATEAIKSIGEEPFAALFKRTSKRKQELYQKRQALKIKPKHVFNYSSIPLSVKKRFFRLTFGAPVSRYPKDFAEEADDKNSNLGLLIHLAWLWENGYVKVHQITIENRVSHFAEVDERIMDFDYDKYDGLNRSCGGIGVNLYDTYYEYGLDKLAYLLKEKD